MATKTKKHRPGELASHHASKLLRESGIKVSTAKAGGVYSESRPTEVAKLLGWAGPPQHNFGNCIVFRYRNVAGSLNGYVRIKPDCPRKDKATGEVVKYEAPKSVPPHAYLPPGTIKVLHDTTKPLVITEGEKKALKADQEGLFTIGLSGVWSWCKPKTHPKALLPDLALVEWQDRKVFLTFDSDIATKQEVQRAEYELTKALQARGADVRCVRLPTEKGGAKIGLDDYLRTHSVRRFRALMAKAKPPEKCRPDILPLDDVEEGQVKWIWPNRLPKGKLILVSGDPGARKGFLAMDIAARITRGDCWPDTQVRTEGGTVIIIGAEDSLSDTIKPRLRAAEAVISKVVALPQFSDVASGMDRLKAAVKTLGDVRLVIFDPISAYMGDVNTHRNSEVRRVLDPLATWADETGVSVFFIDHLNKASDQAANYRSQGSIAFLAVSRSAWMVVKDRTDENRSLFLPNRVSNAKPIKGLAYHLEDTAVPDVPRVVWEGEVEHTIRTALKPPSKRFAEWASAETWLMEKLTNKRVWVKDLEAMARKDAIGWTTIIKASRRMGVKKDKPTGKKGFKCHWTFPRKAIKKAT